MSADRALSRRALGSGVAALAASTALVTAGCDSGDGLDLPAVPGLPDSEEEPDRPRVLDALRGEHLVLVQLRRTQRRHRRLRRQLRPVVALHQGHVDLLSGAVDTPSASPAEKRPRVPTDPGAAVAALVRLERALAAEHVDTAVQSESGVLARVVATMSAAAAQQAVVLSALTVPTPDGGPTS